MRKSPAMLDFFDSLHNASLFCPRIGPKSCRCAAQTPADTGFLQAFNPTRGGSRPLVLPLQKRTLFLQTGFFDKLRTRQNIRRVLGKYMGSAAARRAVGRLFRAGMEPISKRWSWRRRTAGTGRRRQCWRGCTGRRRCGRTPPRSDTASGGSWRCPAWCTPPR